MEFTPGMIMDAQSAGVASELLPDGMIAADADATVSFLNTRAATVTGVPAEDLLGRDIRKALVLHDSDGSSWWGSG